MGSEDWKMLTWAGDQNEVEAKLKRETMGSILVEERVNLKALACPGDPALADRVPRLMEVPAM
jgi:hypothetical protein